MLYVFESLEQTQINPRNKQPYAYYITLKICKYQQCSIVLLLLFYMDTKSENIFYIESQPVPVILYEAQFGMHWHQGMLAQEEVIILYYSKYPNICTLKGSSRAGHTAGRIVYTRTQNIFHIKSQEFPGIVWHASALGNGGTARN